MMESLDTSTIIYGKNCRKPEKEKETRKYYKYNKVKHLTKNYRLRQKMKNRSIQKELEDKDKEDRVC